MQADKMKPIFHLLMQEVFMTKKMDRIFEREEMEMYKMQNCNFLWFRLIIDASVGQ